MPITNDHPEHVLWGAAAIGRLLSLSERQVYHLTTQGLLPVGKLHGRLFARRDRLIDHLDQIADHAMGGSR